MSTIDDIHKKLQEYFPGAEVTLVNTSSQHVGHNNSGMHLKTTIIYNGFEGKSTIDQHKMVGILSIFRKMFHRKYKGYQDFDLKMKFPN